MLGRARSIVQALGRSLGGYVPRTSKHDTERQQAFIRLYVHIPVGVYLIGMAAFDAIGPERDYLLWFMVGFALFSIAIMTWVLLLPGVNLTRRVISMTGDFCGCTWMMSHGGGATMPIFAVLLWVVLGTGLRFGPRYLQAATVLALISLAVVTSVNDYWRDNPYAVVAFAFTAIAVPLYVMVLLTRIEKAFQAATAANLSKSRFLAQASHDLRQPIHAISLYTACLRDAGLQAKELQVVDSIDRSLGQVQRLFKSLLDISTLDSGRVTPKREPVMVSDVLRDVQRQNAEAAQRAGCVVKIVRCREWIKTDRVLLTNMLQNLVTNAIKYAPGSRILLGCRRKAGTLTLVVFDQGPGIAHEHHSHIFEEFYQVRARGDRDIEGVGLGLSIVRRLGELLELRVELRSEPSRGTCVSLAGFPIVAKRMRATTLQTLPLATSVHGLRVLLVEDDDNVRDATATLLASWGCTVQAEAGVPSEVDACDLLITDYDLGGGMTGTECIRAVREQLGCSVPAVVMTGHDAARVRTEIDDLAIPILSKPVRPAELRSVILVRSYIAPSTDESPPWWPSDPR